MNDQNNQSSYDFDEETEEKFEKHEEKHDKDPLSSIVWALILIWAGLVFLARNMGWLEQIRVAQPLPDVLQIMGLGTWSVIALGAGVIILAEALIRTIVPAYRTSIGGSYFLAAIFIGIGLSGIFGWQIVWPFILIAMGLSALFSALIQNR
jgi:hypothetical protein